MALKIIKFPSLDEWRSRMLLAAKINNTDSEMLKGAIKEHDDKLLRLARTVTKFHEGAPLTDEDRTVIEEAGSIVEYHKK